MPDATIDDAPSYLTTGHVRTLLEVSLNAASTQKVRWNTAATGAPGVGDDDADGYGKGSFWFDGSNGNWYACLDGTTGAAVWLQVASTDGVVLSSLFDANTILAANADDTPAALTVPEQTLVGRITAGNIDALTATEVRTLLNVADGSTANPNAVEASSTFGTDNVVLRSDSTSRLAQSSGATLDDSDNLDLNGGYILAGMQGVTNANTSITAADSMNGQIIYCTAGSAVTFTINDSLSTNVSFIVVQFGAGQVSFAAGGSVTLAYDSGTYSAATAAQYRGVLVHCKASGATLGTWLDGGLAAA